MSNLDIHLLAFVEELGPQEIRIFLFESRNAREDVGFELGVNTNSNSTTLPERVKVID